MGLMNTPQFLLYLAIGALAGGLFSVLGTGAGLVIIPALILFAHFSAKTAIGTSIFLLLPPIGLFAAINYWKQGHVDVRAAVIIIIGFMVSSYFVSKVATHLPDSALSRAFGIAAIGIGVKMLIWP